MRQPRIRHALRLAAVFTAVWLPTAAAQEPAGDPAAEIDELLFEGAVEVPVVNVEVHVQDRDGRPVVGLAAEDFEVLEDGVPVEVTNFYAVEGLPRRDNDLPVRMRGTPSPPRAIEPPEEDRLLQLVLYVDNANLGPLGRRRIATELLDLLDERVERGDRVMVASSYPSLQVHTPFTRDLAELHQGIKESLDKAHMSIADKQRRFILSQFELDDTVEETLVENLLHTIRLYSEEKSNEVRRGLWELRAFIGSLAGLPGRKMVIHVSDGLPQQPGQDMFDMFAAAFAGGLNAVGTGRQNATSYDVSNDLLALTEEANASGVTFLTLDASGGRSSAVGSMAENRGLSFRGGRIGGPEIEALRHQNLQNPLRLLATETGGVAILNAARPGLELAERQGEILDTYYSLGYVSPNADNDRFRAITVRVKEKGFKVRHREGYVRKGTLERVENRTVAALLHQYADNPLGVFLEVGEPEREARRSRKLQVPVEIKVPLQNVVFLPFADDHRGRIRLLVGFRNADGTFGLAQEKIVPLVIPNDQLEAARQGHYTMALDMRFRPGSHRLAVGVFDEVGSKASFVPHDLYLEKR